MLNSFKKGVGHRRRPDLHLRPESTDEEERSLPDLEQVGGDDDEEAENSDSGSLRSKYKLWPLLFTFGNK